MAGRRAGTDPIARGAVALAVALTAAALLAGLLGFSSTLNPLDALLGRGAIVTVPDLAGRPQPGAEADLRRSGLVPKVRTSYSLTGTRGTVISQTPPAGSRVREGAEVDVVVSRGLNRVEMPAAVGQTLDAARAPLDDAGIDVTVAREPSETVPKGVVISQEPGPGVVVTAEDEVRLVVSEGAAPRAVPDVTGLALEGAAFRLGQAGFTVGAVTPVDDASAVLGSILRTDPAAGAMADRDTPIALAQAAGAPPVAVPDLNGRTAEDASAALKPLGLVPNVIRGSGVDAVTAQDPAPTTMARPGTVVTVQIGTVG